MYLTFQGRSELKHSHVFTYDESQAEQFPWDKPEDKTGLTEACRYINEEMSTKLAGVILHSSIQADNKLCDLLQAHEGGEEESKQRNLIKACSEALTYAVAKSFCPVNIYEGFVQSFYPRDEEVEGTKNTKLLISVLNGGKIMASAVKFSKVYLIIDAASAEDPYKIINFYQKFLTGLKKQFAGTKVGEAGFKVAVDGSFFNANANIIESLKMVEDSIVISGANDDGRKIF